MGAVGTWTVRSRHADCDKPLWRSPFQPETITNRAGATRELSSGVFYFPLSAFADLPLDVICIGRNGNERLRIDVADLE